MHADFDSAIRHWKSWFGRRAEVVDRILPDVERWEWSTGSRWSVLPFHFERYPGRGRVLREPPSPKAQCTESGYGSDGRLLVERTYDHREQAHETYLLHGEPGTEIVAFSPRPHIPLEGARVIVNGGRVDRHVSFRLNGYTPKYAEVGRSPERLVEWLGPNGRQFLVEDYHYEGGALREVAAYAEMPGVGPARFSDRFAYESDGSLAGIDRAWPDGTMQAVYRPRRKGRTLEALLDAAVAELVPAVLDTIGTGAPRERLYCVELSYREVERYFPPLITLGLERSRAGPLRDPTSVFRPLLLGGRTLDLPDPDALASCRQFDQEVRSSQRWELGGTMLRRAAAELSRRDWHGIAEVTDDFVVFATDPEFDDLEEALASSARPGDIANWKAKGWL